MTNARRTAALALVKQEQNGYSNLVLAAALEREALSPKDKAFVSAIQAARFCSPIGTSAGRRCWSLSATARFAATARKIFGRGGSCWTTRKP